MIPYGPVTYGCEAAAAAFFNTHCKASHPRPIRDDRGPAPVPDRVQPAASPGRGPRAPESGACGDASAGDITTANFNRRSASRSGSRSRRRSTRVRQPYFVQYVPPAPEAQVRQVRGEAGRPHGHDDDRSRAPGGRPPGDLGHDELLRTPRRRRWWRSTPAPARSWRCSPRPTTPRASSTWRSTPSARPGRRSRRTASWPGWSTSESTRTRPSTQRRRCTTTRSARTRSARMTSGRSTMPNRPRPACCRSTPPSRQSVNAVFARLAIDIGGYNVANMAYKLGIPRSDHLPTTPSVILGSGAVSPLDMTHAYSTIAANGVRRDLLAVTKVQRYGGAVAKFKPDKGKAVIPDGATAERHEVPGCQRALLLHRPERASCVRLSAAGRQDRHDRRPHRRLVLRLHARTWPPASGSAIRAARCRCDLGGPIPGPAFGGGYPATIWRPLRDGGLRRSSRPSSRRRRGPSRGTS